MVLSYKLFLVNSITKKRVIRGVRLGELKFWDCTFFMPNQKNTQQNFDKRFCFLIGTSRIYILFVRNIQIQ